MAELTIYNTLTRSKETFRPIDPTNVRMYVCGPTVYDFAHIGNARPAIVFDVLYRLLKYLAERGTWDGGKGETKVTYVRNITDVDDKINARARRDFPDLPLNEAIARVTKTTADQYHKDVAALRCLEPTHEPRATQHIPGMVAMIQQLLDKGHAYVATGGEGREVLFDVVAMPDYGQLSKRRLDEQQAGARIAVEAHKKNPADFVLWKESAANEPGWNGHFHWQGGHVDIHGRPGWHIECSVMSEAHLGKEFDIHGGGLDLIFPHHENEIAQSRCAHGTDVMARYWMHNGFLQVEGKKMSKSEGNFVTIHELLETEKFGGRKWPGEVLRLAMLMTHYREPIDFSVRRLEEAERILLKWRNLARSLSQTYEGALSALMAKEKPADTVLMLLYKDLDTVGGIMALQGMTRVADGGGEGTEQVGPRILASLELLGFGLANLLAETETAVEFKNVENAVVSRLALLAAKNFAEADRIRDELAAQGIQLMDYKDPETGERRTKWELKR